MMTTDITNIFRQLVLEEKPKFTLSQLMHDTGYNTTKAGRLFNRLVNKYSDYIISSEKGVSGVSRSEIIFTEVPYLHKMALLARCSRVSLFSFIIT